MGTLGDGEATNYSLLQEGGFIIVFALHYGDDALGTVMWTGDAPGSIGFGVLGTLYTLAVSPEA